MQRGAGELAMERTANPLVRLARFGAGLVMRTWRLAEEHELNPWVFISMSLLGYLVQLMVFLPWFQGQSWQLAFLIGLRVIALVVPTYILLKGRRIAAAFNISVAAFFIFNTTWHVCYYIYF